jgi:hypothetical protein
VHRSLLPALAALAIARPAAGEVRLTLVPALTLDAGWDSNLFLDARLNNAPEPAADGVVHVAPRLTAGIAGERAQLLLDYDLSARLSFHYGAALDHLGRAALVVRAAPVAIELAAVGELYDLQCPAPAGPDAACHAEDSFLLGGGEVGLRVATPPGRVSARIGALYRADVRAYPLREGQTDVEQRATAFVDLTAPAGRATLGGGMRASWLHADSSSPGANLDRLRGDLDLALFTPRFAVRGGYGLAWQRLPTPSDAGPARVDLLHHGWLYLAVHLTSWLALFASGDALLSSSDRASGTWERLQVVGGIALRYPLELTLPRPPPPLTPAPPAPGDGRLRFRLDARAGAQVALLGEWNGWDPIPLTAVQPGRYQAAVALPPGRWRYGFTVDGQPVRAPDAEEYAPDGFGGTDGIVTVR